MIKNHNQKYLKKSYELTNFCGTTTNTSTKLLDEMIDLIIQQMLLSKMTNKLE